MNFFKKKLTKFAREIIDAPEEERNPHFQKLIDNSGDFLNKYLPDSIAKKGRNFN